jgi:hypothetical protein
MEILRREVGGDEAGIALNAGLRLAQRRAQLLNRPAYPSDLEFGLSIMCWWPIGPKKPPQYVEHAHALRGDIRADPAVVDSLVPDDTLIVSHAELHRRQESGRLEEVFRPPQAEGGTLGAY